MHKLIEIEHAYVCMVICEVASADSEEEKKWLSLQQTISVSRYTYDQDNLRRARSRAQRNNDEPEHKKQKPMAKNTTKFSPDNWVVRATELKMKNNDAQKCEWMRIVDIEPAPLSGKDIVIAEAYDAETGETRTFAGFAEEFALATDTAAHASTTDGIKAVIRALCPNMTEEERASIDALTGA